LLGVVALRHDDLDEPVQITDAQRDGTAEIARSLVLEFERGLLLERGPLHRRAGQLGIDDLDAGRPRAPPAHQDGPLARRDEHTPVLRDLQVLERAGQPIEREVDGEDAPDVAAGVEERRRARDAEAAAGVELVGLRPHHVTLRRRGAEVRTLRRPVPVVVHPAYRLAASVGEDSILHQSDPLADRKAVIHEHVAAVVALGADEVIGATAVTDPAHVRVRAQERQRKALERPGVVGIELALLSEQWAQPHGGLGVLQRAVGVRSREPRRLQHRGVEQGTRAPSLLEPGEAADECTGEPGQENDEPDESKRERRTAARAAGGSYRSNSTRYSFTRLASAASGLSARYFSKAALARAGSFCW